MLAILIVRVLKKFASLVADFSIFKLLSTNDSLVSKVRM
jgi:hypothetical protein